MNTHQLDRQALHDLLDGATFLGSGGGGPRRIGQQIINSLDKAGTLPKIVALGDLDDAGLGAVSAVAGSPNAVSGDEFDWSPAVKAFEKLNEWAKGAGKPPLSFVLPGELGGANSFIPLAVAAHLSLPVVDTSGARRAVPSLADTTFAEGEVEISPMVLASPANFMSVTVSNASVADNVLRAVIGHEQSFANLAGVAAWPMTGAIAKARSIRDATSYARGLGAAIRTAPAQGKVDAALAYTAGVLLAQGRISAIAAKIAGGFDHTTVVIDDARHNRHKVRVFSQNENLIAYSSTRPKPLCVAPDLICYLTPDGRPFSNADPELKVGTEVALIGVPVPKAMHTPYFISRFEQHLVGLGYGGPWVPVAELRG